MNYPLVITDPDDLHKVIDAIHDRWFDLDRIQFEAGTSILQIPFSESYDRRWKKFMFWRKDRHEFQYEFSLEIRHVTKYEIIDTVKVGIYNFSEIKYDGQNKLEITTGIPLGFTVYVSRLEVAVRERSD